MTEDETTHAEATAPLPANPAPPLEADLGRQVRLLRRWLIVLTAVVALLLLSACFFAGVAVYGVVGMASIEGPTVSAEQVADTKAQYEKAFGDQLQSLDVRAVTVEFGDAAPLPFRLSMPKERSLYVEYRLKGSPVVFANVMQDASDWGMMPTAGAGGMSDAEFRALVKAYGEQSKLPFGGVHAYNDPMFAEDDTPIVTVAFGGVDYATKDLWVVGRGVQVEGDEFKPNAVGGAPTAFVFAETTSTAGPAFTYVGLDRSGRWVNW